VLVVVLVLGKLSSPIQSWIVGMTAKGAAIHRTTRCHVAGRRYFAEPPLNGLKPDSPGAARLSSPKSSPYPSPGRGDVARSASPQDRRPTKQTERSGHTNPVQLMPPRFEHEHDDEHEHDLVADLGVRLRRAQSSRSVERSAALRLCRESSGFGIWRSLGAAGGVKRRSPSS